MIDDFIVDTPTVFVRIPSNPSFPIIAPDAIGASTQDNSILGGERNIQLTVLGGDPNIIVSTTVAQGEFNCATPNGANGNTLLQFDGVDGTIALDTNGLGNRDFTTENAFAIRTDIESDLPTTLEFRVYSPGGGQCTYFLDHTDVGDDVIVEYVLRYDDFDTQGCDFSNVGAFEVFVNQPDNVDVIIYFISVWGPTAVSPSPSRTPTPGPSVTRTPTPAPSVTRTPTPSPSDTCVCRCPIFTCEVFRVDDGNYYFYDSFFATFFVSFFDPGYYVAFFSSYFFDPYFFTTFFSPTYFYYFFDTFFGTTFFDSFFSFDIWYGLFFS